MGRSRTKGKRRGAFGGHKRAGTKLVPPMLQGLPIVRVEFERDLLPEYLWIAALVDQMGVNGATRPYYGLLDALDTHWQDEFPPLGLLSDFAMLPPEQRTAFKKEHEAIIREAFHDPVGRILAFYPECPAAWLVDQRLLAEGGALDPEVEMQRASNLVGRLLRAKDDFAGHVRMLPLGRVLKHGKLHFPKDFPLAEVLTRYPNACTNDERADVQSFGRMEVNHLYHRLPRYATRDWSKYFWRHNFDLVPCDGISIPLAGAMTVQAEATDSIQAALEHNATCARAYIDQLSRQAKYDLYDPLVDEILLGLLSRCARLFSLMAEDPNLWARDTAGIFLRCLADTAITFGFLARKGTNNDFRRFKEFGEGQDKLLMLHLEESHPGALSLEGRKPEAIAQDLGPLAPALLQIELGSWSGKDTRKLASAAGMEHLYRLVFSPGSGDVHGTWASLAKSNLAYCRQPLHRFHRLPSFSEPPLYLHVMITAQELMEAVIEIGVSARGYPTPDTPFGRDLHALGVADGAAEVTERPQ